MRFLSTLARFFAPVLLFAVACGGAGAPAPEPAPVDDRPRLDDALVWDVPLGEASDDVRFVWENAQRVLAEPGPDSPSDLSLDDYTRWMHANWSPWLESRVAVLQELRERFIALGEAGSRERIFAAVVAGYVYDDFAKRIEAMPVPVEVQGEPELTAAFAEQLRAQAAPAWRRARESFSQCVEWAPDAPPELAGWGDACARRLTEIPEVAVAPPSPREIAWPTECTTHPEGTCPGTTEPAPTARRRIALLSQDSGPLTQAEMDRVIDAVHARLRRTHRAFRLLPMREVRAARALAEARRFSRRLSCARAPSTRVLLTARHADLVTAWVRASCYRPEDGERVCELSVSLGRSDDGSPLALGADLDEVSFDVSDWLAVVPALDEEGRASMLLGSLSGASAGGPVVLRHVTTFGAWGDASTTDALGAAEAALAPCRDLGDVPPSDLAVVLEVAPDGGVADIDVELRDGATERVACATHVFEDLEFPSAEGPRRLTMTLEFRPDRSSTLPFRAVEARLHHAALDAPAALADRFLRDAVARCYAGNPNAHDAVTSHRARLTVDRSGAVTGVALEGTTTPLGADEDLDACITGALRTARFACTPDGSDVEVEATICVGGR
ncbi:MAG: hypothetical protein JRH11_01915 [Deltaproteobacteria bacterium]|nr:hypothetical protein [Deltaproteobacteria bacterium]